MAINADFPTLLLPLIDRKTFRFESNPAPCILEEQWTMSGREWLLNCVGKMVANRTIFTTPQTDFKPVYP